MIKGSFVTSCWKNQGPSSNSKRISKLRPGFGSILTDQNRDTYDCNPLNQVPTQHYFGPHPCLGLDMAKWRKQCGSGTMLGRSLNLEDTSPSCLPVLGKACSNGFATMLDGSLAYRHEIGKGQILKDSPYSAQANNSLWYPPKAPSWKNKGVAPCLTSTLGIKNSYLRKNSTCHVCENH